jgi:hypothetical protein
MNYTVEIGLGATIHMPSVIKTDLGIQKLLRDTHTQTH